VETILLMTLFKQWLEAKVKAVPMLYLLNTTPRWRMWKWRYIPTVLGLGGEWSASHPGRFTPKESDLLGTNWTRRCVGLRAGLSCGKERNTSTMPYRESNPVLPIAHRYTDWAIPTTIKNKERNKLRVLSPASELYPPSHRRLSTKLVPTFTDRGGGAVSVTDPYCHILGFLDRSHYFFFQVAPQLYSRGWVDPVTDPLRVRKFGSAGNPTRILWICSQELWSLDHRGDRSCSNRFNYFADFNRLFFLFLSFIFL
jgi:hypothetical protein